MQRTNGRTLHRCLHGVRICISFPLYFVHVVYDRGRELCAVPCHDTPDDKYSNWNIKSSCSMLNKLLCVRRRMSNQRNDDSCLISIFFPLFFSFSSSSFLASALRYLLLLLLSSQVIVSSFRCAQSQLTDNGTMDKNRSRLFALRYSSTMERNVFPHDIYAFEIRC